MADGVLTRKVRLTRYARRTGLFVGALFFASMSVAGAASGQTHEVSVDGEIFRKTADGRALAELGLGLRVQLVRSAGAWAEIVFSGWVPTASLDVTTREGHDRVVTRGGGENLLDAPSGAVRARLFQGLLLDRTADRESWTEVGRTGWVPLSSLRPVSAADRTFSRPTTIPDAERPPALVSSGRRLMTGEGTIGVRGSPDGDTVAVVRPGTPITVVERGNAWTRVRVEGWVPSDQLVTSDLDSAFVEISAASLRSSPDDYRGVRVRWSVQFIALEYAEPERTDFYEGEPFLLARAPDPADGFVYITVPPELLDAAKDLRPLQMIDVLAEVRTGRSTLMGVPVLDLLALF